MNKMWLLVALFFSVFALGGYSTVMQGHGWMKIQYSKLTPSTPLGELSLLVEKKEIKTEEDWYDVRISRMELTIEDTGEKIAVPLRAYDDLPLVFGTDFEIATEPDFLVIRFMFDGHKEASFWFDIHKKTYLGRKVLDEKGSTIPEMSDMELYQRATGSSRQSNRVKVPA